jgi:hypothetical protein
MLVEVVRGVDPERVALGEGAHHLARRHVFNMGHVLVSMGNVARLLHVGGLGVGGAGVTDGVALLVRLDIDAAVVEMAAWRRDGLAVERGNGRLGGRLTSGEKLSIVRRGPFG